MLAVHCSSLLGLLPCALEGWKIRTLPVQGQSSPKDWEVPTATTACISPAQTTLKFSISEAVCVA